MCKAYCQVQGKQPETDKVFAVRDSESSREDGQTPTEALMPHSKHDRQKVRG